MAITTPTITPVETPAVLVAAPAASLGIGAAVGVVGCNEGFLLEGLFEGCLDEGENEPLIEGFIEVLGIDVDGRNDGDNDGLHDG